MILFSTFFRSIVVCILLCFITLLSYAQKIGLLMDSYVIDRWRLDEEFFVSKVESMGGECIVKVPHGDPNEQLKMGRELIEEGVDALVVVPCDANKASAIVDLAKEANVPVLSYDRMIQNAKIDMLIAYNGLKVGTLQAEYVFNKKPRGNYLLINGPKSDNNAILFRKGQLEVLQPHIETGDIKILDDIVLKHWSEIEALMTVDEFLDTHEERPDVIIAANDAIASGAIEAMKTEGLNGKVIVTGQDADLTALKNILADDQSMTIYKPIKPLAHEAATIAIKLAKGEEVKGSMVELNNIEVKATLLTPVVVDKSNYKETVVVDGHASMSEIIGKQ